ncbi:MAG: hypothetical protein IPG56_10645 [Caulobacteraceae bacterium]|nr:hypothetical protein [Caulobacteraceae bacterium]
MRHVLALARLRDAQRQLGAEALRHRLGSALARVILRRDFAERRVGMS